MTPDALIPVATELLLFALAVLVILLAAFGARAAAGPLTMIGLVAAFGATFIVPGGTSLLNV